jgi:signal transduction histidine kinase
VLLNLGSNAVKYNRPGGELRLQAAPGEPGRVRLALRDTGCGMSREQLAHLFQPFDRLGQERSQVPGTGLGLLIARQLVEAMDGTLAVDSQPGVGTVVTLDLPAA